MVNGTTNGTNGEQSNGNSSIKPDDVANRKETPTSKEETSSKPNSSNLKCLEDPNFSFDETPAATTTTTTANLASESKPSTESSGAGGAGRKPSYRVLEDPDDLVSVPKPKTTGYKVKSNRGFNSFEKVQNNHVSQVLEDPMMTSIYEPVKSDPTKGRPEEVSWFIRKHKSIGCTLSTEFALFPSK